MSPRIPLLIQEQYNTTPEVDIERAILLTDAHMKFGHEPSVLFRAYAFAHILQNIPVVIRDHELIVGNLTKKPRGSQLYPEFSYQWFLDEIDEINKRDGDVFIISKKNRTILQQVLPYWKNKTVNELAKSYMLNETLEAMDHDIFTVNNYYFNGVGHISVDYEKVLNIGYTGIIKEAEEALFSLKHYDPDFVEKRIFLESLIVSCQAVIEYACRFANEALRLCSLEKDETRKKELEQIATICRKVPAQPASTFYEAAQSFWFVHLLIQIESNGHSISPMRFDQYMYPFYKNDQTIDQYFAQELIDCVFIKLNEINKIRDKHSTKAFGGYPLFQNLIVGGQDIYGKDATNELSYMCLEASCHTKLPQPSISIRVWNQSPKELLRKAAFLSRLGTGMPAYYNDGVIIDALMARGVSLEDARDYGIIGCVEPQKGGKTEGWHDSAFFNLARILEMVLYAGKSTHLSNPLQLGVETKPLTEMSSIEDVIKAYEIQMTYFVKLLVNAENSVDIAHRQRCPLPFLSSMVDDCIQKGKSIQEGGAHYNFTGPQGVGVANVGDSFMALKQILFDEKIVSAQDLLSALESNFTRPITLKTENTEKELNAIRYHLNKEYQQTKDYQLHSEIKGETFRQLLLNRVPKYGNDLSEPDLLTKKAADIYCKEVEKYENPRGGKFQPGLYPASINVAMGSVVGATPDGRKGKTALADGVSPSAGMDRNGPTATLKSVSVLDHKIASNGTLLNQKFNPMVLEGDEGLNRLVYLVQGYFQEKGMHVQFNVISKETLIAAQKDPTAYKNLVVRVAGYSAQFVSLDKSVQDDIIQRTEQSMN